MRADAPREPRAPQRRRTVRSAKRRTRRPGGARGRAPGRVNWRPHAARSRLLHRCEVRCADARGSRGQRRIARVRIGVVDAIRTETCACGSPRHDAGRSIDVVEQAARRRAAARSAGDRLAARQRQHLAGDEAGIGVGSEIRAGRCDLIRPRWALERRVRAGRRHFRGGAVRAGERRPHRPGHDAIQVNGTAGPTARASCCHHPDRPQPATPRDDAGTPFALRMRGPAGGPWWPAPSPEARIPHQATAAVRPVAISGSDGRTRPMNQPAAAQRVGYLSGRGGVCQASLPATPCGVRRTCHAQGAPDDRRPPRTALQTAPGMDDNRMSRRPSDWPESGRGTGTPRGADGGRTTARNAPGRWVKICTSRRPEHHQTEALPLTRTQPHG